MKSCLQALPLCCSLVNNEGIESPFLCKAPRPSARVLTLRHAPTSRQEPLSSTQVSVSARGTTHSVCGRAGGRRSSSSSGIRRKLATVYGKCNAAGQPAKQTTLIAISFLLSVSSATGRVASFRIAQSSVYWISYLARVSRVRACFFFFPGLNYHLTGRLSWLKP